MANDFTLHVIPYFPDFSKTVNWDPTSLLSSLFQYHFHSRLVICPRFWSSEIPSDLKSLLSTTFTWSFLLKLLWTLLQTSSPLAILLSRNPLIPRFFTQPQTQTQVSCSKNALQASLTSSPICPFYQFNSGWPPLSALLASTHILSKSREIVIKCHWLCSLLRYTILYCTHTNTLSKCRFAPWDKALCLFCSLPYL